eukprot:m.8078 g.8078  ORF g.8078 m.8078 type:complete len:420 (+) comp3837_c0_seq2:476-1735(+)
MACWPVELFLDAIPTNSHIRCTACKRICADAVTGGCEHAFGRACLVKKNPKMTKCPICNKKLNKVKVSKEKTIASMVDSMWMNCVHQRHGCQSTFQLKKIGVHMGECPYRNMKFDSVRVHDDTIDPQTEMALWFVVGLTRTQVRGMAEAMLMQGKTGEFLIRDRSTEPNCYGLSIKNSKGDLDTYVIEKSPDPKRRGYLVRGSNDVFDTVYRLVKHYSSAKREDLGIKLRHPGNYLADYASSGYSLTQKNEVEAEPVKVTYSKGSLLAKEKAAMDELDELDDDDLPEYDMASQSKVGEVAEYDMASQSNKIAEVAEYDMASGGSGPVEYDMATRSSSSKKNEQAAYEMASSGNVDYDLASGGNKAEIQPEYTWGNGLGGFGNDTETGIYDNQNFGGFESDEEGYTGFDDVVDKVDELHF